MALINKKYLLLEKIGEGSFGFIYKGQNIRTNEFVAIKIEKIDCDTKILKREAIIYQYINNNQYTPQIKWFGKDNINHYMVINLLGGSLKTKKQLDGPFSLTKTLETGLQIIELIEFIHNKDLIHRDIKPDNFLYNINNDKLFIIDFGFCKPFIINNKHIREKKTNNIIGSLTYASINAHELNELSRRDDLESIAYMLIFLYLNNLPWSNEERKNIHHMKKQFINNKINVLPNVLVQFLNYSKSLSFSETPDYNYIKNTIFTSFNISNAELFIKKIETNN